jgi:hypothetical protein
MPILTGIDILGIQKYIFASNRLRDVLAASWLVDHITGSASLTNRGVKPENILLAAGGNAIIEFDNDDAARDWVTHYTRWLYETANGLEVVIAHRSYSPGRLAAALRALQVDLARAKSSRLPSSEQLGLSVTAECTFTGLPATSSDQGKLISRRIENLRGRIDDASSRWNQFLPSSEHLCGYIADFPSELDLLGRSVGEISLLGVVHIDGNGVGGAIKQWLDRHVESGSSDSTIAQEYRAWSIALEKLAEESLRSVVSSIESCMTLEEEEAGEQWILSGMPADLAFKLQTDGKRVFLPIRPILLGGDDLTFVCDGRIALDLAVTALQQFEHHPIPHLGNDGKDRVLTASAGVAFVRTHAPFHRAYDLAERLCRSAKSCRIATKDERSSWIDWHIGTPRVGESIEQIRNQQYRRGSNALTMRPYPIDSTADRVQSWVWLDREVLGPGDEANNSFRGYHLVDSEEEKNLWSRSRIKHLDSLVREGSTEVKLQVEAWKVTDPGLILPAGLTDGFVDEKTPLSDAIELLDVHLRLVPTVPKVVNSATGESR